MILKVPPHSDECWKSAIWRTEKLMDLMAEYRLKAAEVGELTGHTEQTVFGWRASTARPIPALSLRVLMFELARTTRGAA